jgi:hypothetical protein
MDWIQGSVEWIHESNDADAADGADGDADGAADVPMQTGDDTIDYGGDGGNN